VELSGQLLVMDGLPPPEPRSWSRTIRAGPATASEARWFLWGALKGSHHPEREIVGGALQP
jgi:hypothetical protein